MINFRRLASLLLALVLVSAIISFTAASFIGLYSTAVKLMSGGENVLIIYGAGARAPQTSVIPLSLYEKLRNLSGVEAVSPEVVAVAMAGDRAIMVRGVDPDLLASVQEVRMIRGSFLLDYSDSAVAGVRLAELLGIDIGDHLLLRSAFSNRFLEVKIVGILKSESCLDDELLLPVYAAQWLRGLPRDAISLIRIKIDPGKLTKADLLLYLRGEKQIEEKPSPMEKSPLMRLLTIPRVRKYAAQYIVERPEGSMKLFLEKNVRVNEAAAWGIVAVIIFGSALLVYLASSLMLASHSRELIILRSLGASKKKLTFSLFVFTALVSIAASAVGSMLGYLMSEMFSKNGLLLLGSYAVRPSFGLEMVAASMASVTAISLTSIWIELKAILGGEYARV